MFACKEILKNSLLLIGRKNKRDKQQVRAEYDQGQWKSILDRRPWLHASDVEDLLFPGQNEELIAKIENQYVRISTRDYYKYRTEMLQAVTNEFAGGETELVELGCGYGMNLFSLVSKKARSKLIGLDISENAVEAGCQISKHFGLDDRISFDQIDLLDGGHLGFERITGKSVFTYYCLEQLKYSTKLVIDNIIKARPKRVIHIEPTTELLHLWAPKDLVNYLYITRKDYQNNLLSTILSYEQMGKLRTLEVRRLFYAPTVRHDPTLICWEPLS